MPNAATALILALAVLVLPVRAEDPPAEPAENAAATEKPSVRDLGDGKYEVGLVKFDRKARSISFPAEVNMREGPLEFGIVHVNGKIHESLLHTAARPFHINVALKLLRYKASTELFPILDEDYRPTNKFPEVPEDVRNAARVDILLSWKSKEGKSEGCALHDWIIYTVTGQAVPPTPWVYGGSYMHNNAFQAEALGDIAAIFTSNAALFNYPGKDGNLDDVWLPNTKRIPPVGTPVTVTIKPALPTDSTTNKPASDQ